MSEVFWLVYFGLGLWLGISASLSVYRERQEHVKVCPADHEGDSMWRPFDTFMLFACVFFWWLVLLVVAISMFRDEKAKDKQ